MELYTGTPPNRCFVPSISASGISIAWQENTSCVTAQDTQLYSVTDKEEFYFQDIGTGHCAHENKIISGSFVELRPGETVQQVKNWCLQNSLCIGYNEFNGVSAHSMRWDDYPIIVYLNVAAQTDSYGVPANWQYNDFDYYLSIKNQYLMKDECVSNEYYINNRYSCVPAGEIKVSKIDSVITSNEYEYI